MPFALASCFVSLESLATALILEIVSVDKAIEFGGAVLSKSVPALHIPGYYGQLQTVESHRLALTGALCHGHGQAR